MTSDMREPTFWILTALATGRQHGYGLIQQVRESSNGRVDLKVPTLYAALDRLAKDGLVALDGDDVVNGRVRRYFRLTDSGSVALMQQIERWEANAREARRRISGAAIRGVA